MSASAYRSEREQVALACRILAMEGLVESTLGHVSMRVDGDRFLVRSRRAGDHGVLFTTADDIALTDYGGTLAEGEVPTSLPSELPIHGEILRAHPEWSCVVHAHSPEVVACTVAGVELRPVVGAYNVPAFHLAMAQIPTYHFAGLVRTAERAAGLLDAMGDASVCLLQGHGLVTAAPSLEAAVLMAIDVHVLARLTVTCQQMQHPMREVDPDDYRDLPHFGQDYFDQLWRFYVAKAARAGL
ncbi:MAG TPA: class II aldolase/adducin family protein [Acidimicrobiales bacterium]|nr:class II aldolase/adducin family protein [Acidimicrobiales bacterium]